MRVAVRGGHDHKFTGASGYVDEVTIDRQIYPFVIEYLKLDGNDVIDATPPDNLDSKTADLQYGIDKAKAFGATYACSIHLNATPGGYGAEVWNYTGSVAGVAFGTRIAASVAALGFKNRGTKAASDLYELKHSPMVWNIVECFFCDSKGDTDLYNKLGPEAIGKAIAEGIVGHAINKPQPVQSAPAGADYTCKDLQYFLNDHKITDENGNSLDEDNDMGTHTRAATKKLLSKIGY